MIEPLPPTALDTHALKHGETRVPITRTSSTRIPDVALHLAIVAEQTIQKRGHMFTTSNHPPVDVSEKRPPVPVRLIDTVPESTLRCVSCAADNELALPWWRLRRNWRKRQQYYLSGKYTLICTALSENCSIHCQDSNCHTWRVSQPFGFNWLIHSMSWGGCFVGLSEIWFG